MPETLTDEETQLAEEIIALLEAFPRIQEHAAIVKKAGGDVRRAVFSLVPEADRPAFAIQWPMIAMFLGV